MWGQPTHTGQACCALLLLLDVVAAADAIALYNRCVVHKAGLQPDGIIMVRHPAACENMRLDRHLHYTEAWAIRPSTSLSCMLM
jgi:hypothetical protein